MTWMIWGLPPFVETFIVHLRFQDYPITIIVPIKSIKLKTLNTLGHNQGTCGLN